ncbi:hypothetical protein BDV96DRAFT_650503 [Lophiotrema nucula]|uniref:Uncharacterized protein n=1 Tax=Lophiotrema nucula TaxID=690887 RepID=A0A6A5YV78_9PLEO|nr:hypothetical protein BDV96DRAFT_650503 [Lophiotrema nucula]
MMNAHNTRILLSQEVASIHLDADMDGSPTPRNRCAASRARYDDEDLDIYMQRARVILERAREELGLTPAAHCSVCSTLGPDTKLCDCYMVTTLVSYKMSQSNKRQGPMMKSTVASAPAPAPRPFGDHGPPLDWAPFVASPAPPFLHQSDNVIDPFAPARQHHQASSVASYTPFPDTDFAAASYPSGPSSYEGFVTGENTHNTTLPNDDHDGIFLDLIEQHRLHPANPESVDAADTSQCGQRTSEQPPRPYNGVGPDFPQVFRGVKGHDPSESLLLGVRTEFDSQRHILLRGEALMPGMDDAQLSVGEGHEPSVMTAEGLDAQHAASHHNQQVENERNLSAFDTSVMPRELPDSFEGLYEIEDEDDNEEEESQQQEM